MQSRNTFTMSGYLCFIMLVLLMPLLMYCECSSIASSYGSLLSQHNGSVMHGAESRAKETSETSADIPDSPDGFASIRVHRRRSLLPIGTVISDQNLQMLSHVVRIKSRSNGVGTGLLIKKNFVLTTKRVVQSFMDPLEFTIELGHATSSGLNVSLHPREDLAVLTIYPPIDHTGRTPIPGSPQGFFWPLAVTDPKLGSLVEIFGYGGSFSYGSKNFLSFNSFPISDRASNQMIIRTRSSIPTTSGDAGGPGFFNNGSLLGALVKTSKPRQGILISIAAYRDWIFDALRSSCSKEEQSFSRLVVDTDPDSLIYYHCKVDRAERLGIYLYSKPTCSTEWKAILITDGRGHTIGMVETHEKVRRSSAMLKGKMFKFGSVFYIEVWKAKFLGLHTKMAKYGPFNLSRYMDGGLHFEWCAS